jgi:protein-tyrosine kinase
MSLVEKALKKLQDAQGTPGSAGARKMFAPAPMVVGSVVQVEHAPPSADLTQPVQPIRKSGKLVKISREGLRAAGLSPPPEHERRLANEYRKVKRPLIAAALGKGTEPVENGRVIMMASALPGEGKTFSSINLAISMSTEKDITVLLVDADVAKPHISRTFGVDAEPGLVDALQDASMDIESAVIPTDIRGLSILPAGRGAENATELLASARMQQIVARLREADPSRIILFDSPPLLLTNESRVLTEVVGQVVIVVRAGQTERTAVAEAIGAVHASKPVSLVLNQSEATTSATYYGYGDYGTTPAAEA